MPAVAYAALLLAGTGAPCLVIKDTPEMQPAVLLPTAQALPGVYACRFSEDGATIAARIALDPGGSFSAELTDFEGDPAAEQLPARRRIRGRWVLRRAELSLIDTSRTPKLVVASAAIDPKVTASVTIRTPDGKPVPELGVTMEGSSTYMSLQGASLLLRRDEEPYVGVMRITREGDAGGGFLSEVEIAPGQPNRYVLTYLPDRPDPADLALSVVGPRNDTLLPPAGLGAMLLRRER